MRANLSLPRTYNLNLCLSPLRGWFSPAFHPRLTPWAAFLRRSAARYGQLDHRG
jgi:hypothetical protein